MYKSPSRAFSLRMLTMWVFAAMAISANAQKTTTSQSLVKSLLIEMWDDTCPAEFSADRHTAIVRHVADGTAESGAERTARRQLGRRDKSRPRTGGKDGYRLRKVLSIEIINLNRYYTH